MKSVYTKSLINDFPDLHRQAREGVQSALQYGFAIGDGWYQIYYEFCAKVTARACANCVKPESDQYPSVNQVKEKFGDLRISCSPYGVYADLVKEAAQQASHTCENCGEHGVLRSDGWIRVVCDKCHTRRNEIYEAQHQEYQIQERAGGYRKPINDAFAEVDAKAAKAAKATTVNLESLFADHDWNDDVAPKCKCGINKEVCDRTLPGDPDLCRRVAVVLETRRRESEDAKE